VRSQLVLSLFPGIGLLDMAFEEEGFCVVRGPDLLWGGDIHRFHPPAGKFDGVIGGPPCQAFSPIGNVNRARWGEGSVRRDLIPEFARIVTEAAPTWWVMENSPMAYAALPACHLLELDAAWLGMKQARRRAFWSNLDLAAHVEVPALLPPGSGEERTVSWKTVDWKGSRGRERSRSLADRLELQGFPRDFLDDCPFTIDAANKAVGNGVPLPMGRAVARAVKKTLGGGA
jgi:DNA (cytosine-5)-methyltransferase 1